MLAIGGFIFYFAYSTTLYANGQVFVFFDSGKGKDRVIGMSTTEMLTVLCNAQEYADDGTFKIIKPEKRWSQVFTQHANVSGRYVPAVVWFLAKATTESFMRVLEALDDWSTQNLKKSFGLVETSTVAQRRKIEGIQEALESFNAEEMSNSMARMANAIDGIELDDLALDGA